MLLLLRIFLRPICVDWKHHYLQAFDSWKFVLEIAAWIGAAERRPAG